MKTLLFLIVLLMLPFSWSRGQVPSGEFGVLETPPQECDTTGWDMLYRKMRDVNNRAITIKDCYIVVDSTPIVECHEAVKLPKLIVEYGTISENVVSRFPDANDTLGSIRATYTLDSAEYATFKALEKWLQDGGKVEQYMFDSMCVDCEWRYRAVRVEPNCGSGN